MTLPQHNDNIVYLNPASAERLVEDITRALAASPSGHLRIQVERETLRETRITGHRAVVEVDHPAVLKVKVGEGSWSPPIASEQPNGGYYLEGLTQ